MSIIAVRPTPVLIPILADEHAAKAMQALHDRFCPQQELAVCLDRDDGEPDGFIVTASSLKELRRLAALYPEYIHSSALAGTPKYPIYYHLNSPTLTRAELGL